jgi:microcystin-dependent protein
VSSPFVAEIRIFACNFAPTGWALCDGQILAISQNTALFSLLGTFYGGNGQTTFGLPDMQGNVPIHHGQGPGLSEYFLGQRSGTDFVTLLESEMPAHSHSLNHSVRPADNIDPTGLALGTGNNAYAPPGNIKQLAFQALPPAGGSLPHNNLMPYVVLNYCIALQGVFPPRS